jgi:hypothetical protein
MGRVSTIGIAHYPGMVLRGDTAWGLFFVNEFLGSSQLSMGVRQRNKE